MAADLTKATVYRVVVSGGGSNLGQLIAVLSDKPRETIGAWARRASLRIVQEPEVVADLDGTARGIDHVIEAVPDSPGYRIVNRLNQSPFERILVGTE